MPHNKYKTAEDVRNALVASISRKVRDDVWEDLLDTFYVEGVLNGEPRAFEELKKRCLQLDKRFVRAQTTVKREDRSIKKEIQPDARFMAFSQIAAIEAAQSPRVMAFRQEALGSQFIDQKGISAWIEKVRKDDGDPTNTIQISFSLPSRTKLKPEELLHRTALEWVNYLHSLPDNAARNWFSKIDREMMQYRTPEGRILNVHINKDGILGRLKEAAQELIVKKAIYPRCFWWQEYQAVAFILCGVIPMYSKARGETFPSLDGHDRIKMDIDPRVSSQEIASLYAKLRQELFTGRDTPMTDKHAALAVFLAGDPELTWLKMMEKWNQEKPEWAYSDWRTFARDVKAAWKRVAGTQWASKKQDIKEAQS